MCGLFGIVLAEPATSKRRIRGVRRLFNSLAWFSAERGVDAAGMAIFGADRPILYKDTIPSYRIIHKTPWRSLLQNYVDARTTMLMGHTRHGTHGSNTITNAHPFSFTDEQHGELVGTHNGMLFNSELLLKNTEAPFENDSANLFWSLSQLDEQQFPTVMGSMYGSAAVSFVRGQFLYLGRNILNPLFISYFKEFKGFAYASTSRTLRRGAREASMPITTPHEIAPDCLTRYSLVTGERVEVPFDSYVYETMRMAPPEKGAACTALATVS